MAPSIDLPTWCRSRRDTETEPTPEMEWSGTTDNPQTGETEKGKVRLDRTEECYRERRQLPGRMPRPSGITPFMII